MIGELARAGGAVGALGLALLILGRDRTWRVAGLAAWAAGCATLAVWLAPSGHHRAYAAAAVLGAAVAVLLAWLFVRVPWLLAVAVLACAPARIPVSVGSTKANLLLPMYVVVAAAAIALAWELFGDEQRTRELGPLAWPMALFVGWTGLTFVWSVDRKQGAIYLLFFVLPFGLLAVSLARLPWRLGWVTALYVQLAAMAVVFAAIGGWQYLTRNIFWNPKVIVDNAYAPSSWFYRVNSVFYDPSIYGRFLVVAILASLVLVLYSRGATAWAAGAVAVGDVGRPRALVLAVELRRARRGIVVALVVLWRRRAVVPLLVAAARARPRDGRRPAGAPPAGRQGRLLARDRRPLEARLERGQARGAPSVFGVGAGGFKRGYANLTGLRARSRRPPPRTTRRSRSRRRRAPRARAPRLARLRGARARVS